MILLIDNYDSFSYNLYQLVGGVAPKVQVRRNDALTIADIRALAPSHIILSPGPGRPAQAGICEEIVQNLGGEIPILGVCLGHQAICEAYGGVVSYAKELMHGKQSQITVDQTCPIFQGLQQTIPAARYHSLAVCEKHMPEVLQVVARAEDGEVMAVQHRHCPVYGLQFHPESILTPDGVTMIKNFLGGNHND